MTYRSWYEEERYRRNHHGRDLIFPQWVPDSEYQPLGLPQWKPSKDKPSPYRRAETAAPLFEDPTPLPSRNNDNSIAHYARSTTPTLSARGKESNLSKQIFSTSFIAILLGDGYYFFHSTHPTLTVGIFVAIGSVIAWGAFLFGVDLLEKYWIGLFKLTLKFGIVIAIVGGCVYGLRHMGAPHYITQCRRTRLSCRGLRT